MRHRSRETTTRRVSTWVLATLLLVLGAGAARASESAWRTTVFAGNGNFTTAALAYSGQLATSVPIGQVHDLALAPNGDTYVLSDSGGKQWILRIDGAGHVFTVAGGGASMCNACSPVSTDIQEAYHLTIAPDGALWYTEDAAARHLVRRISPGGLSVTTMAGQLSDAGSDGDGSPAASAHLRGPRGIAAAADGSIYIADNGTEATGPWAIRRITPSGTIVHVAGQASGAPTFVATPQAAATAGLNQLEDIEVNPVDGSVWFTEPGRDIVRRIVDPASVNATIDIEAGLHDFDRDAGCFDPNPNAADAVPFRWDGLHPADGSPASLMTLCHPFGLSFNATATKLYISDEDNRRIRRLDIADHTLHTVVGTGGASGLYGYGGPAGAVTLHDDFAVLAAGSRVLFADETGDGNVTIASIQNALPVAHVTTADSGPVQFQPVSFDAGTSSDPDGSALAYSWDFGDGAKGQTPAPSATHSYTDVGQHTVTLTVTDDDGGSSSSTVGVTVKAFQLLPVAAFSASMKHLPDGRWRLVLDGSPSFDAAGATELKNWKWTFSDAKAGSGRVLDRTFKKLPKKLGVALAVTNRSGITSTATRGTVALPRIAASKAVRASDSDGDSIADAKDRCKHQAATVDPDGDGCNGPYAARKSKYGASVGIQAQAFGVALTHLHVIGLAKGAIAQLVCDQGCEKPGLVLISRTAPKNGIVDANLDGRIAKAGTQLSVRAIHPHWVSISTPMLVGATASGGQLAQATHVFAVCSIGTATKISYVACQK